MEACLHWTSTSMKVEHSCGALEIKENGTPMRFQLSLSAFVENGKGRWYPMGFQLIPQLCSRRGAAITSVGSSFVIGTISSYSVHFVRLFLFHLLRWVGNTRYRLLLVSFSHLV